MSAGNDAGIGSDGAQAAAVDVDDFGVTLGREAVVHGLVVDLEEGHSVGLGMSIGGAHATPFGGRRVIEIADPVHRVVDLLGLGAGAGEHDERLGVELAAEAEELIGAEAVVVGVAAPEGVGMVAARGV